MSTNEKGEKIVVFDDGTWQYFDEFMNGETKRHSAKPDGSGGSYPIFNGTIAPLEGGIEVTEADLYNIAVRRSQLAEEAALIAQKRWKKAQEARSEIEKDLKKLLQSGSTDQQAFAHLNTRLKAAQRAEEESRVEAQEANVESDRAEIMTQKGQFAVAAYQEAQEKRQEEEAARREAYQARSYEQSLPLTDNSVGVNQQDLILNPPPAPCVVAHEGIDSKSGNFRKQLKKQFLFSHTDDRLRVYLKDKEYLRCEGYFSTDGGYSYLTLEFTFAYPNAREAYGFIEKGSILTIKMLNDDFVNLYSGEMVRGSYDTEKEILTYRVYYPISRSDINYLKNSEVDAIRVFWSSGFEEYEVYHLDFFSNQLRCLD
ncbi:MAG: cell envelope integrity protein TolA [Saprospiraceae bacterium]|nr:cell envelope integrity protein TolA [Lewinella sp.]